MAGKPRGRQPKVPKHTVDSGGVINISDDSSSDSDGMDTDSNSSPDSLLDNDDVIFVNHTSCQSGREVLDIFWLFQKRLHETDTCLDSGITFHSVANTVASPCPVIFVTLACQGYMVNVPSASYSQPG